MINYFYTGINTSDRMRNELWNVWANTMEEKFKNNSAITEVLEVHADVRAPREALDRIKFSLKRDTERPSWIKRKTNAIAKLFS